MADNVTLPATGSGTATPAVATDDVGGAHYQRMKLDAGGDGVSVPLVAGQQLAAASLPVVLASDGGAATAVNQDTLNALIALLTLAQGAAGTDATGPMVQALVGDSPPSVYLDGEVRPVSLTSEGRLRVSSEPSRAMVDFWPNPFQQALTDAPHYSVHSPSLSFYA